jgi:hypothetical protein
LLTGVSGHFSAAHCTPEGALHGHTWHVLAWFECPGPADACCYKAALDRLLSDWDHSKLPEGMEWGEDIAVAVGKLANCVEVVVSRPLEGFYARWIA